MKHIEELNKLFKKAQNEYRTLKENIESQVVRWFWASNTMFRLDPFWFEQNRYSKGKILKEEPTKNRQYAIQYGVNATDEIIVARGMTSFEDNFYETFYFRGENEILSYHFDYGNDKKPINIKKYVYENAKLTTIYSFFEENGYWIEHFIYENNKLTRKEWKGVDNYGENFERINEYIYDDIGQLKIIKEGSYIWYQKPDKKLLYKKLAELSQEKLLPLLKETIKKHAPNEKLYCINLSYFGENMLPPQIGFGTQSDREQWTENETHSNIIWNVADYSNSAELDLDEETSNLFDLFNQETELNEKHNVAIKLIVECAKSLKQDLQEFSIEKTNDFVIVASCFDQSDFKKNFKAINPEKMNEFKKILI
ncbi:hypothetical protein [Capnocytophaga stomatis]|uniref:hypothetical protein n=1 Tax=Capnocytophaga stomatis TaxID=1848904 RepID=UPI001AD340F6|nr:hypothetical protein [Capnocytophaga stomatis]GIM48610.1 hypothetical protein CAPN003_00620 [Capnocytophaga stomatis]